MKAMVTQDRHAAKDSPFVRCRLARAPCQGVRLHRSGWKIGKGLKILSWTPEVDVLLTLIVPRAIVQIGHW